MSEVMSPKKIYRSLGEFEKEYLPKYYARKKAQTILDAPDFGIILADESLKIIRKELAKTSI